MRYETLEIVQCTFTPICFGVLLAHILNSASGFSYSYKIIGKYFSPLIILVGLLCVLNIPKADISGVVRLLVQLFATLLVGSVVIREDNFFRKFLSFSLIFRIGMVSYGMYLFHLLFRDITFRTMEKMGILSTWCLFIGTLILTYIASEISYHYYECFFLKLKRFFKS